MDNFENKSFVAHSQLSGCRYRIMMSAVSGLCQKCYNYSVISNILGLYCKSYFYIFLLYKTEKKIEEMLEIKLI